MKKSLLLKSLLLAAMIVASPALAGPVDFGTKILNLDGSPIPVSAADKTPLTLGRVLEDALIANNLPGDSASPTEKGARFWIAMKVHDGKDLSADEVATCRKVVGLAYGPLVIGRVAELLDPGSVPEGFRPAPAPRPNPARNSP